MASNLKVTDFIHGKGQNAATFEYYRSNILYYSIENKEGIEYTFPIPIEDMGNGTFPHSIKAITLMRWIRKAIEDNTMIHRIW